MKIYYEILNHFLYISNVWKKNRPLENFVSTNVFNIDICLDCKYDNQIIYDKKNLSSIYGLQYSLMDESKYMFFSENDPRHVLYTEKEDYSEWHLSLREDCSDETFMELLMAGFYSYISLKEALLMHASAISYKECGIVFTAPSGTGKTTQAELWQKYRNAVILNGDKVFLKQETDGIHAWGSPWKGSSSYAENISVPLKAIVVLEQAEENSIRKLNGLEMLEKVIPNIFLPQWDMKCENAVLNFLNQVLQKIDIYLLQCCPDEDAVALVEETLFKIS